MGATTIKDLRENGFVMIDGSPCRVEKVQVSTSGKHGHAKVRLEAIGILDNTRRSLIAPAHEPVEVPMVLKKNAQVLAVTGSRAQLMDMENYEQFELEIPDERKNQVIAGGEADYYEVVGIKTLKQLK
ncbi:translation initiation factor IF-5A [archaeon]|nr:MAG: translation initiation factor IF-5A [archaeon]